jgi:hypothetical protein
MASKMQWDRKQKSLKISLQASVIPLGLPSVIRSLSVVQNLHDVSRCARPFSFCLATLK